MTEEQFLKFWEDAIDHLKLQRMAVCGRCRLTNLQKLNLKHDIMNTNDLSKKNKGNAVLPLVSNSSDLEDDCVYCKDCGEEMEWQECWSCGGEGGRGWEDLQFEDPLWYSPDDFIDCDECEGKGGMWICPNKNCG